MIDNNRFPLLQQIKHPQQLRTLSRPELQLLCNQLRTYYIELLNEIGGHFAGSLGCLELTVALHAIFNTPEDRIVWDVGHQAHFHKMLTGRLDMMRSMRQPGGLSGFPSRFESIYDTFGVGHSSTSISAALGMAIANQKLGHQRHSIAVIGDGALTAGMAYEALNHAGDLNADLIVVLNDNGMSISPNVGALAKNMHQENASSLYESVFSSGKKLLHLVPSPLRELAKKTEQQVKELLTPDSFFTKLGFDYSGPIDGHDLNALLDAFTSCAAKKGPRVLHVLTQKGKGYAPAEADPVSYHAVSPNFLTTPPPAATHHTPLQTYSDVFGQWICDMAHFDSRLVVITAATREGAMLQQFSQQFPTRYFDVGIAEQHAVTLAAGLACDGLKPVVSIYSTFLQRAYDQLIHDVALQNLPVLFAIDRGGLVGADGPTHTGSFDLSFLRCVPNLVIMAPSDENECRQLLYTGFMHNGPAAVRYPRRTITGIPIQAAMQALPIGKAQIRREGQRIALLAFGTPLQAALVVGEKLNATVVDMRFVKPLDERLIIGLAKTHELLVTLEENAIAGGAGSGVNELLQQHQCTCPVLNVGLPDQFIQHGKANEQLQACGLAPEELIAKIKAYSPALIAAPKGANSRTSVTLTAVK